MNFLGYLSVVLFAVALCSGQSSNGTETTDATTVPTTDTTMITDTTQSPVSTTQSPGTTMPAPATTTPAPATTTPAPATTTPAPATTTPAPVTTTPAPVTTTDVTQDDNDTTTAPPVTSSVAPETTSAPPINPDLRFEVENDNVTCILAQMEITISVNYPTVNGDYKMGDIKLENDTAFLNKEKSTNCSSGNMEPLVLNILQSSDISFVFTHDGSKITVSHLSIDLRNLTNIFNDSAVEDMSFQYNSSLFETSDGFSYLCNAETKADLIYTNGSSSGSSIKFQKVQVQAFIGDNRKDFLTAKDCAADDNVSDIVPIAVGCALAGLVVIVLIAYLVGRRQKRQRGYESV